MSLRYVGKDPNSEEENCPTVLVDDQTGDYVLQGWAADDVTITECERYGPIAPNEAVIRIPARMTELLKEAIRGNEHPDVR
ncbi:hypothetical protein ABZY83_17015 [Streptomyces virginiae]|uniref:hypothetical protein n=1 Tax=Streptomyces virginiae TaxID=1961 RepID=UPI0033B0486B